MSSTPNPTNNSKKVVTRFAPSPTGLLHVGSVRTMLYSYYYAKQQGGTFVLRIEDTDRARSKPEFEQYIYESMEWLGIKADETYVQSQRTAIYRSYLEKLIAEGKAYPSTETNEEGKTNTVIRFKNPNTSITFRDEIRGDITFDTTDLKDFVIARNIDDPLYHFVVVVDDFEMGITHVIRGEDHISNTPRQILIQEAIGAPRPAYAHLPLILAPDRTKLSKRRHGEMIGTLYYRDQGYTPEAMINFTSSIGWNPGGQTTEEFFTIPQMIERFTFSAIQKGGGIFDMTRLKHFNRHYISLIPTDARIPRILERFEKALDARTNIEGSAKRTLVAHTQTTSAKDAIADLLIERISVDAEIDEQVSSGEFDFIFNDASSPSKTYSPLDVVWKKDTKEQAITHLTETKKLMETLADSPTKAEIETVLMPYAEAQGKGSVLWPLRFALSGKKASPDPVKLITILGKYETIERIDYAVRALNNTP